jgi:hypothetical protein
MEVLNYEKLLTAKTDDPEDFEPFMRFILEQGSHQTANVAFAVVVSVLASRLAVMANSAKARDPWPLLMILATVVSQSMGKGLDTDEVFAMMLGVMQDQAEVSLLMSAATGLAN